MCEYRADTKTDQFLSINENVAIKEACCVSVSTKLLLTGNNGRRDNWLILSRCVGFIQDVVFGQFIKNFV